MSTRTVSQAPLSPVLPPPIPRRSFPPAVRPVAPTAIDEPETESSWERLLASLATSFGVSLVLHLAVLATLAFWILRSPMPEELALDLVVAQKDDIAEVETAAVKIAPASLPKDDVAPLKTEQAMQAIAAGPNRKLDNDVLVPDFVGSGHAPGNGDARGIFGTGREGRSFVFVVDCSGSMIADRRFDIAVGELLRTISGLKPTQEFFVVFYSSGTIPLFSDDPAVLPPPTKSRVPKNVGNKLIRATTTNKNNARDWVKRVQPGGGTRPRKALEIALKLKPEVVYFLTDGEIPQDTADVIRNANKSRVIVHTVALGYEGSGDILQRIAKENKGRYTFVK